MPTKQKIIAIFIAVSLFIGILELVRRRKLQEEYSWLWLLTGFTLVVLTLKYEFLIFITNLIGAVLPTSTLFFLGLIFVMIICIHFSIRISMLSTQVKNLTQEIALFKSETEKNN